MSAVLSTDLDALLRALPKTELHLHLEGSIPPDLLLELAEKHGVPGVPATLEAVEQWYEFRDFAHFITVYETAVSTLRDEDDFARLVGRTADTLAAQNVRYAELVITPGFHVHHRGVDADAVFGGIERGRLDARERHGLELRWVPDFGGQFGVEAGDATLDLVLAAGLDSVVGFNVGGPEVDRDPFAELFARARDAGLHSIPHAGEAAGPERVWSALRALHAERIGHGVRSVEDPALVEHLAVTGTPLDVCPTSNLRTRVVDDLASHPLPTLVDAGVVCTLNTDDPTMFGADLVGEYHAAAAMGVPTETLVELARNGVRVSYADDAVKAELLAGIDEVADRLLPAAARAMITGD